jgi:protein-disulfide isomerase
MIDRRLFIGGALALAPAAARSAELLGDDGKAAQTWRLPSEIVLDLPQVVAAGSKSPDAILYEFFDYNCPWCKKSAPDLDKLVAGDKAFSLRLIQNPILSLGSVQAAKVVLAVHSLAGDASAYAVHRALLAHRGQVSGEDALAVIARAKLDRAKVEERADSDDIRIALRKHAATSRALGMDATPSFAMNGMGVGGWPGAGTIARMIGNVRACDALAC